MVCLPFDLRFTQLSRKIKIHRTIILPDVLYGYKTWSLALSYERRQSVLDNMMLRTIFGPKRSEVTGQWRKLHNEQLNDMYCPPKYHLGNQIKKNEMGGACGTYGRQER